tara:strand:+ start:7730 stop:8224 length:495 start_codon:yes stop_codon:yes gene_type:complete
MQYKIKKKTGPIGKQRVQDFESQLGVILPEDYFKFLCENDHCYTEADVFDFIKDGRKNTSILHGFFGFDAPSYGDIVQHLQVRKGRIPSFMLPIASDPGGNDILIGIKGEYRGHIYFWDHEMEYDEDQDDCTVDEYRLNLHFIAADFKSFINSLRIDEDLEEEA